MPIKIEPLPAVERLQALFRYDSENGEFLWKRRPLTDFVSWNAYGTWNSRWAGKPAGFLLKTKNKRYLVVCIDYRKYLVHRIVWKMVTGNEPAEEIDHADNDGLNNKWTNLREASRVDNLFNKITRRDNRVGLKGVGLTGYGKYKAMIRVNGVQKHLGVFDTALEAHKAYCEAAIILHREFYNSGQNGELANSEQREPRRRSFAEIIDL